MDVLISEGDFTVAIFFVLRKTYLELEDEVAAQRIFGRLLKHFPDSSYKPEVKHLLEKQ